MGTLFTNMKLVNCVLLLATAALCIQAVTNEADLAEMGELDSMVGDPTDLPENPTKAECTQVARSLPVICKMFGKKSCVAFNSKMSAKCGANAAFNMEDDNEDIGEDDDEEMASSDDEHAMADEDESNDVGESAGLGRRGGGGLMTSGSFVMMSANRAGNDEEELGEEDDEEVEEWDLSTWQVQRRRGGLGPDGRFRQDQGQVHPVCCRYKVWCSMLPSRQSCVLRWNPPELSTVW